MFFAEAQTNCGHCFLTHKVLLWQIHFDFAIALIVFFPWQIHIAVLCHSQRLLQK